MSEQIIEQAIEVIDDGRTVDAMSLINELAETDNQAEELKEEAVRSALAERAFNDEAIGIFIRNHNRRRKIARSDDPEINRMLIRVYFKNS